MKGLTCCIVNKLGDVWKEAVLTLFTQHFSEHGKGGKKVNVASFQAEI
jgi:hypothetical protein